MVVKVYSTPDAVEANTNKQASERIARGARKQKAATCVSTCVLQVLGVRAMAPTRQSKKHAIFLPRMASQKAKP